MNNIFAATKGGEICVRTKGIDARCRFRELKANIALFLPAWVGRNHFVNTKIARPAPEICKSSGRSAG